MATLSPFNKIIIGVLSVLLACAPKSDEGVNIKQNLKELSFSVEVKDSFIINATKEYVKENKINPGKAIIVLKLKKAKNRTFLYMNHSIHNLPDSSSNQSKYKLPTYYTFIDNVLVMIYTDIEEYIFNSKIEKEIRDIIKDKKLELEDQSVIHEPLTWRFEKCEDRITKEVNNFFVEDLPCGVNFRLNEQKGEFEIIEEE